MFPMPLPPADAIRLDLAFEAIEAAVGSDRVFFGDNLIALNREVGFLRDPVFRRAFDRAEPRYFNHFLHWRLHGLCWAGRLALAVPGAFVETGVLEGFSMRVLASYLDLAAADRPLLLYDLFDNPGGPGQGVRLMEHDPSLVDRVRARFADLPAARVIEGRVPEILDAEPPPGPIAFLHVDLNDAAAETAALDRLWPLLSPGAVVVFDDYGWAAHAPQGEGIDRFVAARNLPLLELPTGQGVLFKPQSAAAASSASP
jgi:hypothetical protein